MYKTNPAERISREATKILATECQSGKYQTNAEIAKKAGVATTTVSAFRILMRERPDLVQLVLDDRISIARARLIQQGKAEAPGTEATFVSRLNGAEPDSFAPLDASKAPPSVEKLLNNFRAWRGLTDEFFNSIEAVLVKLTKSN